jgi:hypothetical protein
VDRDGETLLLAGEGVGEVAGEGVREAVGERVLDVHQMIRQPVIRPEISLCLERDRYNLPLYSCWLSQVSLMTSSSQGVTRAQEGGIRG